MKSFIFIHIAHSWVYRLYEEYIQSIIYIFSKINYKVEHNIHIPIEKFNIHEFHSKYNELCDLYPDTKFLLSGDISIFCQICNTNNLLNKNRYHSFLNIEQMSHPSYYTYFRNIPEYIPIIDYSEENVEYLKKDYSVLCISPFFSNFLHEDISIQSKTIDCLSIHNNAYRQKSIDDIQESIKPINIYKMDSIYGIERDKLFTKTKIYINIHCSDKHQTLELIRIVKLLSLGVIVISEDTVYSSLCYLSKYIYFTKKENMHIVVKEILNNYTFYYEKLKREWNEEEYLTYIISHVEKVSFE